MPSQLDEPIISPKELTDSFVKPIKIEKTSERQESLKKVAIPKETKNNKMLQKIENETWVLESKLNALSKKVQETNLKLEGAEESLDYLLEVDRNNRRQIMDNELFQNNLGYLNQMSTDLKRCEDQNKALKKNQENLYKAIRGTQQDIQDTRSEFKVCYIIAGVSFIISIVSLISKFF